jgi:hypothetical protein
VRAPCCSALMQCHPASTCVETCRANCCAVYHWAAATSHKLRGTSCRPEVVIVDEIGTEAEALACRSIAERGVQLVGTAHGQLLENLIKVGTPCLRHRSRRHVLLLLLYSWYLRIHPAVAIAVKLPSSQQWGHHTDI